MQIVCAGKFDGDGRGIVIANGYQLGDGMLIFVACNLNGRIGKDHPVET
jgi:hypothetical protein